jgi:cobyrinic acid a,c-diamide synthase
LKKALLISAIASNHGKTLLTTALLHHYKKSVRPYKCGPDFIDPQFHQKVVNTPSINLDGYMMDDAQVRWIFAQYFNKETAIVEGVMGYYDGMDKNSSAYDIAKLTGVASLLVLDGSGSYITLSAVLKGLKEFRDDNTIKGVVINKVSSQMHYELIKKHIEAEVDGVVVCGWIQKGLKSLSSTHLGLDLEKLEDLDEIVDDVLAHIAFDKLESIMSIEPIQPTHYPFEPIVPKDQKCAIVYDKNFSFLYHDNLVFLQELYRDVVLVDSTKDEIITEDVDLVVIVGGYVESDEAYRRVKNATNFKNSLIKHAKTKKVYGECAGLIYLGKSCDAKEMSGILPITFELTNKRERLGYYRCDLNARQIKGHAFHYTRITSAPKTDIKLYKTTKKTAKDGGYQQDNVFATYLHTMWRVAALDL